MGTILFSASGRPARLGRLPQNGAPINPTKGPPWEEAYSIDPADYLAIRLFYERELAESAYRAHLGLAGTDRRTAAVRARFPRRLSSAARHLVRFCGGLGLDAFTPRQVY